jgi:hypothetical protein
MQPTSIVITSQEGSCGISIILLNFCQGNGLSVDFEPMNHAQ